MLSRMLRAATPDRGGRKALPESGEQERRALEAKAPGDERPHEALLLGQDAEPGPAVCGDAQIRLSLVPFLDLDLLVGDHDGCPSVLLAREREVVRRVEPFGGAGLESEGKGIEEAADPVRPHPGSDV